MNNTLCTMCHSTKIRPAHATTPEWTDPFCVNCHYAQGGRRGLGHQERYVERRLRRVPHGSPHRHDLDPQRLGGRRGLRAGRGDNTPTAMTTLLQPELRRRDGAGLLAERLDEERLHRAGGHERRSYASAPNSAYFASDTAATAKIAQFEKTFDLAERAVPADLVQVLDQHSRHGRSRRRRLWR